MSNWDQDDIKFLSSSDVKILDHMGSDNSVANAARVSTLGEGVFSIGQSHEERNAGLINFLMKNRHGTPFEHNAFQFFVKAPIFVFREFQRHRIGFSYNEMSGRYMELRPEFYIPPRGRPTIQTGKPGHYVFSQGSDEQYEAVVNNMGHSYRVAWHEYQQMIAIGIAKEVARDVLPVGIYSQMYVTCNARSLMSFLSLRTKDEDSTFPSYPLYEIEQVAIKLEEFAKPIMPITLEAFDKNGRVAP